MSLVCFQARSEHGSGEIEAISRALFLANAGVQNVKRDDKNSGRIIVSAANQDIVKNVIGLTNTIL